MTLLPIGLAFVVIVLILKVYSLERRVTKLEQRLRHGVR